MTWFKLDDTACFHPKMVAAGNAACGLWMRAAAWSMQNLTDGYVPRGIARTIGSAQDINRLVDVGLWENEVGGYQFHEWLQAGRQRSKEEVEEIRLRWAEKKKRQRLSPRDSQGVSPPPRPDQTREVQKAVVVELGNHLPVDRHARGRKP